MAIMHAWLGCCFGQVPGTWSRRLAGCMSACTAWLNTSIRPLSVEIQAHGLLYGVLHVRCLWCTSTASSPLTTLPSLPAAWCHPAQALACTHA